MANVPTLELMHKHLFRKEGANLTPKQQEQLIRYEAAFVVWLDKPYMRDTKLRDYLIEQFGISKTQAYEDIRNLQVIFGNVKNASKEWYRYLANELVKSAVEDLEDDNSKSIDIKKAEQKIKAALALDRINRLNKLDADPVDWSKIIPQNFEPTNDPTKIKGWKKNWSREELRKNIDKMLNKYQGQSEIVDIDYDELPEKQ